MKTSALWVLGYPRASPHGDGARDPQAPSPRGDRSIRRRHFPDPERFDPERFGRAAEQERPRFAYFPFGGGRRQCLGEGFAWMEGLTVLAGVVQRFALTLVPGQTVVPDPNMTLRPKHGIRMRVGERGRPG